MQWNICNKSVQESFSYIKKEIISNIDRNVVLVKRDNRLKHKPKWMDNYCMLAVRNKYKAWQRYIHSRSSRHYKEYCKLRNKATKAVRFARIKHERGIADTVNENCKSFWSYVNNKTNIRSGVSDLRDTDGILRSSNKDKANIFK